MLSDDRGKLGGMQFGSPFPGLFETGCEDPRKYTGPPNPRRCNTPQGRTSFHNSRSSSTSPKRPTSSMSAKRDVIRRDGMLLNTSEGNLSLTNFDVKQEYSDGMILLDSPRSVQACLRLGIIPSDLLAFSLEKTVETMKRNGEDISDLAICKERHSYLVRRQKKYFKAALDERNKVLHEETFNLSRSTNSASLTAAKEEATSSMIQREEHRLQKIVETNRSRLRQQLLHSQLLQKQREREDERLANQRKADERRKQQQLRDMMEKSRKEEEAQMLRNEARELERREQAAKVELRRTMYEVKDQELKERMRERQMRLEAENEAKQLQNRERRALMKEQSDKIALQRRENFKQRWLAFEFSREEHAEQQKEVLKIHQRIAAKKEEKIQEAISRCNENLEAKIKKTEDRERAAQEKLKEFEKERGATVEERRALEEEKEKRRKEIYKESVQLQQSNVVRLTSKIKQVEIHMKQLMELRAEESRHRQEVMRQRELDKQDCVLRSKRMENARVAKLEDSIVKKNLKIALMKDQQEQLKQQRKIHRQEVERTRVSIPEITPGPGDYLVTNGSVGTAGPTWKFGLPSSVMSMRVVSRDQPAPGYEASPGPCLYNPDCVNDARHRRAPTPTLTKHNRWNADSAAHITPGPADYAPTSPNKDGVIEHIF